MKEHGLIQVGQCLMCKCAEWSFILPEDQTWTAMLKSYAAHRPELRESVERLYFWQYQSSTSFSARLFELIQKGDQTNRGRLRLGFPEELEAAELWNASPSSSDFFEAWGMIRTQPCKAEIRKIIERTQNDVSQP